MGFTIVTVMCIDVSAEVPDELVEEFGRARDGVWDERIVADCCPPAIARFLRSDRPLVMARVAPQTIRTGTADGGQLLSTARLSAHWELHDDTWAHGGLTFMTWVATLQSRELLHPEGGHTVIGTYFDPYGAVTEVQASAAGITLVRRPWSTAEAAEVMAWDDLRDSFER